VAVFLDSAIAARARRQGGHVTRLQLLALGLSGRQIDHRLAVGRLIAVFRGVYAVGHLPTNPLDRAAGALLACGERSALSHGSAGALWGVWKRWRFPLELSTAIDRRPSGLIVHRTTKLTQADIWLEHGLRVTSPALTVLQVAPRLTQRRLTRVINDLRLERRLTHEQLAALLARFPRHPGAGRLRPLVETTLREPTRSELEDAFQLFVVTNGLPQPLINHVIEGYRVDAYFPLERLVVELDGWQVHRTRAAFERDRRQDAEILERAGIPTLRITYERLIREPAAEAARLHVILRQRRRQQPRAA
jgi:hypothetical protein